MSYFTFSTTAIAVKVSCLSAPWVIAHALLSLTALLFHANHVRMKSNSEPLIRVKLESDSAEIGNRAAHVFANWNSLERGALGIIGSKLRFRLALLASDCSAAQLYHQPILEKKWLI